MMYYLQIWRQIRGYSKNNQRTHSNNKNNKKNKIINNFRLQQFFKLFGKKKKNIFPTIILGEYNNRLWYLCWKFLWLEAKLFIARLAKTSRDGVHFDPYLLAKNIITGINIKKKKKKNNIEKKKKILLKNIKFTFFFLIKKKNFLLKFKLFFKILI